MLQDIKNHVELFIRWLIKQALEKESVAFVTQSLDHTYRRLNIF
jgi:hypothetical protein